MLLVKYRGLYLLEASNVLNAWLLGKSILWKKAWSGKSQACLTYRYFEKARK
jgi:hypothetical protein